MFRSVLQMLGKKPAPRREKKKSLKNVWRLSPTVLQLEDRVVPSNYLVTTTADIYVPPVPASPPVATSLRYALEQIHNDSSGAVMNVLLPAGTYNIGLPVSGVTDTLGNKVGGAFVINPPDGVTTVNIYGGYVSGSPGGTGANALTLDGNSAGTVINAQGFDRVFEIDPETTPSPAPTLNVNFVNMTITGGAANSAGAAQGGGIFFDDPSPTFAPNQNSLSLTNVVVTGNLSTSSGGGIYTYSASVTLSDNGTTGSLVSNNHAQSDGGGIGTEFGNVTVINSGVNANTTALSGGGIYVEGSNAGGQVNISGSSINNNSADESGGGIWADGGLASMSVTNSQVNHNLAGDDEGGGIKTNAASISLDHAQISFNQAGGSGGGIYIDSSSAPTGNMMSAVSVDISGNKSGDYGGGIDNEGVTTLTITYSATPNPFTGNVNSTINNNIALYDGGGIYNATATTFAVYGTTVSGTGPQGAQISGNDVQDDSGGGIYSDVTGGSVVLSLVTMDGNDAGSSEGGAVYAGGSSFLLTGSGSTPSVISNNESSGYGGGLSVFSTVVTIQSTQFLGNAAASDSGGGIYNTSSTTTSIGGGTLFAGNQAGSSGGGVYSTATNLVANGVAFAPTTGFGGNVSGDSGGGLYFDGTNLAVASSFLVGNTADEAGGGAYSNVATSSFSNTLIANNVSNTGGGGLYANGGPTLNLALTTVAANMTAGSGGGVYTSATNNVVTSSDFLSNNAATGGGGIYHAGTNMLLNMSSVIANTAGGQGSGGGVYNGTGTVNIINTTVANNTAGVAGGGLANTAGGTASLLYATLAFNQAPIGGGIAATTTAANTALGNSIVTQNFNYAYPGANFITNAAYPGNQNGNLLPTPPFPTTATTGPDIHGSVSDLTETGLVASMGGNLSAAIGALAAAATTIGHNIFGTVDSNNTATLLAVNGDQVGTSSAPILAVQGVTPNSFSAGPYANPIVQNLQTLLGPTLPGNQVQYMAAPQAAPAGTSNPLTTALNNGFADTFVFNVAPGDQRGTPVLNGTTGLSQQYLRPITITFTMPPSNNPTVGAMQVN